MFISKKQKLFFAPLVIVAAIAIFGALTMLIWNAIMPDLFRLGEITFWQAVLLLLLCRLLFGFGFHRTRSPYYASFHEKLKSMTPEEREKFKNEWSKIRRERWKCFHPGQEGTKDSAQKETLD